MRDHRAGKVEFLVAGTQKGGTTALYEYLRRHPRIAAAQRKEAHYFDDDRLFQDNPLGDPAAYHARLQPGAPYLLHGDFTPIYMYWRPCMQRVQRYNPHMRIVILLRDPAERAHSHWNMEVRRGWETLDFPSALRAEAGRLRGTTAGQHRVFSYIDRGRYAAQLKRVYALFPANQVHVARSEDLLRSPQATLDGILRFLGLPGLAVERPIVVHRLPYADPMRPCDRDFIAAALGEDIAELERLLGWDCNGWTDTHGNRAATAMG